MAGTRGRFVITAQEAGADRRLFWRGPGMPPRRTWGDEYPDALKFDSLSKAATVVRTLLHNADRPTTEARGFDVPIYVVEDYGLATEITHEIG